jgi:rhamnosyl/mannosyltransferase
MLRPFKHKVEVIPGGIDTRRYAQTPGNRIQTDALRRTLAAGRPVVLFVGRLVYYKGLEYLLRAVHQTPAALVVVGQGPKRPELEGLAEELGMRERVTFVGTVKDEDLPAYYLASDIVALPSSERTEAFGLVQVEAHASGRPVVNTLLGTGVNFVNQHLHTGLTVPPKDVEALSHALNVLINDGDLRRSLGAQAKQRAQRLFDVTVCAKATAGVYRTVLDEVAGTGR